MLKLREIISFLEKMAPPALQESYDNSGLITGHADMEISGAVICLDSTPEVIEDAIAKGCNLVIAHHPIIFSGLKKINGKNYIERAIIKAIKHDVAIYAIHTNLDNVIDGVNGEICRRLGLTDKRILSPKSGTLRKIVVFVPEDHKSNVMDAMFSAGAGNISDYSECSFSSPGTGTFKAGENSSPFVGGKGERHHEPEARLEMIFPAYLTNKIVDAARSVHPYEEMAYDIYELANKSVQTGSGMIGRLAEPMDGESFLRFLKQNMNCKVIRHTQFLERPVSTIAVCGGSGSFLIGESISSGADVLVTSDIKYHQFFDADGKIMIADIGHYESEQFTIQLIHNRIAEKFPTFATHLSGVTNPVLYF